MAHAHPTVGRPSTVNGAASSGADAFWLGDSIGQPDPNGSASARRVDDPTCLGYLHDTIGNEAPGCGTGGLHEVSPIVAANRSCCVRRTDRRAACPGTEQGHNGLSEPGVSGRDSSSTARVGAVADLVPRAGPRFSPRDGPAAGSTVLRRRCARRIGLPHMTNLPSRQGCVVPGKAALVNVMASTT